MERLRRAYSGAFLLQALRQDRQRYGKESFKAGFISIAGRTVELFREGQKNKRKPHQWANVFPFKKNRSISAKFYYFVVQTKGAMKNEVKKIYDKSAFRENGYLIEKQKKVWLLSLSLRFSRFFAKLPGLFSDIAERFKGRCTKSDDFIHLLARASYVATQALSASRELAGFSEAFVALPYAKNEELSTQERQVFTFVVKLSEAKRLRDFSVFAENALRMLPAANEVLCFFDFIEKHNALPAWAPDLEQELVTWIEHKFPKQAEAGFPRRNGLGLFKDSFESGASSKGKFERELLAAFFPLSALSGTASGLVSRDIPAALAILRELSHAKEASTAKAKKRQKNLTREQDQEVIRRNRVDGLSISEIATEYKRSENAIRDVFKRNGIEWKRVRKKRKERFVDGKAY